MKTKKLLLPAIFLALTIIAYIAASVIFCYTTEPEITTGEFPFSITYEYKGETKTLSGVFKCEYSGSWTIWNEHNRYWLEEEIVDSPIDPEFPNVIDSNEDMVLALYSDMSAGYFMGDPLYADWYEKYGLEHVEPRIEYHNYPDDISLNEENKDELLEKLGLKIIDYTYAEPIENSFSFSGVLYEADNVPIFVLISLVFLILCMIFVRKDKEYNYSALDKIGIVFNFAIGILALPFITFFCWIYGIVGGSDIVSQIIYNIPVISITCFALSIALRRTGIRKTGFFIQFVGVVLFSLIFLLEGIL